MRHAELERYIHEHIPLSKAMGVSVVSVDETAVTLQAPLGPNINHRGSAFGGSASALAILASWALLHVRLQGEGVVDRLVIQRSTIEYQQPILGPFMARSSLVHPDRWPQFTAMLARRRKARVAVSAVLEHAGQLAGTFSGEFVAFGASSGASDVAGA
jgi:thioesterase domain-containing protein